MPKIERSSFVTTPKAQSVSRTSTPAEVAVPTKGTVTEYAGQAAPPKELVPRGANLSKSASPSALWGEAPAQVNLDAAAFAKLSPADQVKTVEAARVERTELGGEIVNRVEVLDRKWDNSRLSTRTEALREYHDRSGGRLDRGSRKKLDGLVHRSEESQRKINELRVKIDALPRTPEAKKAQVELRNQLARELLRARDEQSKAVKEATAVVDAAGLKVDRLAVTEQIIDPSAPAQGSGGSLLDKIERFISLDWFFETVARAFSTANSPVQQRAEQREQAVQQDRNKAIATRIADNAHQVKVTTERARDSADADLETLTRARAAVAAFASPRPASGA